MVQHTPAYVFVHRFAIGTATGSSDSEAVNENVVRGVSHYEAKHIPTDKTIEADACIRLN
ncbi:MAG: hypothetical protein K5918_07030 [Bacteroidales bacterium]|nr:hypothetical protein [Bacteroidales bacterium]